MDKSIIEISVVAPIFNEEGSIIEFVERVCKSLEKNSFEIIMVNDGSTDQSNKILKEIAKSNKRVRYISLSRNMGQSCAIYCGFQNSIGKYVVMMDGDLQNLPEDILILVEKTKEGYDLVSGERVARKESFIIRKLPSKLANWLLRKVSGCQVRDMAGFKCIRGEIARNLRIKNGHHRLLPAIVHIMGGSTTEVPVRHAARKTGISKYSMFPRTLEVFFDVLFIWFQSSSKSRPLYFFGRISIFFFMISGFLFLYLVYQKQFLQIDIGNRPLFVINIILLLASFGSIAIGFITELLSSLVTEAEQKKPYIIKDDSSISQEEQ